MLKVSSLRLLGLLVSIFCCDISLASDHAEKQDVTIVSKEEKDMLAAEKFIFGLDAAEKRKIVLFQQNTKCKFNELSHIICGCECYKSVSIKSDEYDVLVNQIRKIITEYSNDVSDKSIQVDFQKKEDEQSVILQRVISGDKQHVWKTQLYIDKAVVCENLLIYARGIRNKQVTQAQQELLRQHLNSKKND